MEIFNLTKKTFLAKKAFLAGSFLSKFLGLIPRAQFNPEEALIISGCQAIHMCFMKFAIDAVFVDKKGHVTGKVKSLKPFCFSPFFLKASYVIELPTGAIEKSKTEMGDQIEIRD